MRYKTLDGFLAFSTGKEGGVETEGFRTEDLGLPRQTHTDHVVWMTEAGRPEETDAVITKTPGLCIAVKTADCIPVLLYDHEERIVAAIHAGWRGTVNRIVEKTIRKMYTSSLDSQPSTIIPNPSNLHAIIGPGISLDSFEVGDEVYEHFCREGFPMERIARLYPSTTPGQKQKWHLDLWEANRWILEQCGVMDIQVAGIDTMTSAEWFSARRETINTGRNYNAIVLCAESCM